MTMTMTVTDWRSILNHQAQMNENSLFLITFYLLLIWVTVCVKVSMCHGTRVGIRGPACLSQFSPSFMWVLGIELRWWMLYSMNHLVGPLLTFWPFTDTYPVLQLGDQCWNGLTAVVTMNHRQTHGSYHERYLKERLEIPMMDIWSGEILIH